MTVPSDPIPADPRDLGMEPHPEGGWYRETWRSRQTIATPRGDRALATSVSFLLQPGEVSAWHRVASDELWIWSGGGPVRVTLGGDGPHPGDESGESVVLGPGGQFLVPAGQWQTAEPDDDRATLVACIVAPGFDFADFELVEPSS